MEAYNGNTGKEDNKKALEPASAYDIKTTGGSDAHCPDKIGTFATSFPGKIRSIQELAASLRNGDFHPVIYDIDRYRNIRGSL